MTTVFAGSSRTFTSRSSGSFVTVTARGGSVGSITDQYGNRVEVTQTGLNRTFGPLDSGVTIIVSMQIGSAFVKADNVNTDRVLSIPSRAAAVLAAPVKVSDGKAYFGADPKSLVPLDPKVSATVYYVDSTNGNDTNNGTTWALAVKSIWKAVTLGNTAAVPYTVNIAPGTYFRANGFSNNGTEVIPTQSCLIQGANGQVVCVAGDSHTWTLESGTTYQTTRSNAKRVFDMASFDADGDFYEFTLAASLAACRATPGSWYTDNTTTYVNRLDGAAATATNTMVILQAINTIRATTSGNMHMYRITQYGGNSGCIKISGNTTGKFYAEDCAFKYSATSTYIDGVQSLDYALVVLNKCVAAKNQKDGFNFHTANSVIPAAVLFDCWAYGNGTATASTSNNGVTMHDAGLCITMNTRAWGNVGGDIAHANTDTMGICICDNAMGGLSDIARGGEVPDGVGFQAVSNATLYKYDCQGSGDDFVSPSGGRVINA